MAIGATKLNFEDGQGARNITPLSTAPIFSSSTAYAEGDLVYYNDVLYKCTTAHNGVWNASHFTTVTISGELKANETEIENVKSDLSDQKAIVALPFSTSKIYTYGTYCYYDDKLYVCNVARHQGAWSYSDFIMTDVATELWVHTNNITDLTANKASQTDLDTLEADVEQNYARKDGYYQNLTAGSAEQLISTVTVEDKVPYKFRTSGGSADIGNRETDKIVGGTIAWNQLCQNGNFASVSVWSNSGSSYTVSNNVATINATSSWGRIQQTVYDTARPVGHKFLITADVMGDNDNAGKNVRVALSKTDTTEMDFVIKALTTSWQTITKVFSNTYSSNGAIVLGGANNVVTFSARNVMLIDLTQMFGSTIADYIYSLEQSTAGAGVAFFRKLFPKPYYAYDAGTLKHVEGLVSHDTTGFNQWDEEWESGYYDIADGTKKTSSTWGRCADFIRIVPNTVYTFKTSAQVTGANLGYILYYDADKQFIGYTQMNYLLYGATGQQFTSPSNAYYMTFYMGANWQTTNICINISWDGERNGEYEAYVKHSYPLDDSLVLRGIPKLDSNNQLYYDGDIYASDGTVTRKYGIVDLGTLNWVYISANAFFTVKLNDMSSSINANCISSKYSYVGFKGDANMANVQDKSLAQASQYIKVKDTAYTDADTFKTAMSGVYLVYELATSTTEQAEPYTNPQICDDFGTEEYVTDSIVHVGHDTQYMNNLRAKLEMLPESPDSNGDYIVRHADGENTYVPLVIPTELPTAPSNDGTYTLKVTVSNGTATYSWVSG